MLALGGSGGLSRPDQGLAAGWDRVASCNAAAFVGRVGLAGWMREHETQIAEGQRHDTVRDGCEVQRRQTHPDLASIRSITAGYVMRMSRISVCEETHDAPAVGLFDPPPPLRSCPGLGPVIAGQPDLPTPCERKGQHGVDWRDGGGLGCLFGRG